MKKIVLWLLFALTFLIASNDTNNTIDAFVDQQIKAEAALLDLNISKEEREEITQKQESDYKIFFVKYASDRENYTTTANPYSLKIFKLKNRIDQNQYRGNQTAVLRDNVILKQYNIYSALQQTLQEVLQQSESKSMGYFKDKVSEIVLKRFSEFKPIDRAKYAYLYDQNQSSEVEQALKNELQTLDHLYAFTNAFSSQLIENSGSIYRTSRISGSRLFAVIDAINTSPYGKKVNGYLSVLHIDLSQIMVILLFVLFIIVANIAISKIIHRILSHYALDQEDIAYIHARITRLFHIIASLLIIHIVLVIFLGPDTISYTISKYFGILYIILVALLLYRLTKTIASYKVEQLQKSKILKKEVINLAIKAIYGLILFVAAVAILLIFGVNLTALLSGLGIGGIAVALAAKDSIANVFGSISILAGDIFDQGDWIEIGGVSGTVVEIGLRATTLRTFDNALVSVPNYKLVNDDVINWNRRSIGRRILMNIGVTYESDFDDIKLAIKEIRLMLKEHPGIAGSGTKFQFKERSSRLVSLEDLRGVKRTALVYMHEFADSSIIILVDCFSRSVDRVEYLEAREDVMFKIAEIFKRNRLEFAYPSMTIHQANSQPQPISPQEE